MRTVKYFNLKTNMEERLKVAVKPKAFFRHRTIPSVAEADNHAATVGCVRLGTRKNKGRRNPLKDLVRGVKK